VTKEGTMIYFARKHDCGACALKPKCCPNAPARKIARSIHEAARDKARAIAKTEAYAVSRRERKKVEMLFAHLKRILRLDRLRLRGPSGAKDEFLLAATAQNLRKLAKLIPFRHRSSPHEAVRPSFAALTGTAHTQSRPPQGRVFQRNSQKIGRRFYGGLIGGSPY
jgi:Transposase DDE domain